MEISDVKTILQDFEEIQEFMKCQSCNNHDKVLARIKICGHYSCRNCLNKTHLSCPKCKTFCNDSDIVLNNVFTQTEGLISTLKELLVKAVTSETLNSESTIVYQNKTYRVNFVDVQKVNSKGETLLHVACKRRNLEEVRNLLIKQVDINAQDFAGWVPLHEAIESESKEIVEILLSNGALVDVPGPGYTTPLHKAVSSGNIEIIELLLKNGANKDAIDYFGKKPHEYIKNSKEIERLFNKEFEVVNKTLHLFYRKKVVPFCYYTELLYKKKLKQRKIKIEENYNPRIITHFIIRKNHKVSINILKAMLDGCVIVPQEWIDDYLNNKFFIHIPTYNFINLESLNSGIRKAMINKMLKLPKLFDGINFYISGHNLVPIYDMKLSKDVLTAVITAGGGKVLRRSPTPSTCEEKINFPYHASGKNAKCCNYVIYADNNPPVLMYHMSELKHKPSKWLIDCVIYFTIFD